jgi:hypothetical protein
LHPLIEASADGLPAHFYGATAFGPAICIAFWYAGRASMRFT